MKTKVDSPQRFQTSDGRTIYALCIEVFPRFFGNVYVIDDGARRILVDTGSGTDDCNRNLVAALATLEEAYGIRLTLADIDVILITHGHMDHFGGLRFVREHTDAPIGVHPLDRRILSHYQERVVVASKQLRVFLHRSGLSEKSQDRLMAMYSFPKRRYGSMPVDFLLQEGEPVLAPLDVDADSASDLQIEVLHVPGHCPGQVCLRLGDVLLTADHVLARITPHQAPASITLNTGLWHYLESLKKVRDLADVRVGLGGHEAPIAELTPRVDAIVRAHDDRLAKVVENCSEPRSVVEVSQALFGKLNGYDVLLGLEEAGAHVEYLHQLGALVADNLDELEAERDPPVRYIAT